LDSIPNGRLQFANRLEWRRYLQMLTFKSTTLFDIKPNPCVLPDSGPLSHLWMTLMAFRSVGLRDFHIRHFLQACSQLPRQTQAKLGPSISTAPSIKIQFIQT